MGLAYLWAQLADGVYTTVIIIVNILIPDRNEVMNPMEFPVIRFVAEKLCVKCLKVLYDVFWRRKATVAG